MGLIKNELEIYPKGISCLYCDYPMIFSSRTLKKDVPKGATDLGIYEKIECLQCLECNQTSTELMTTCHQCGSKVLAFPDGSDSDMRRVSERLIWSPYYPSGNPKSMVGFVNEGILRMIHIQNSVCIV